MTTIAYDTLVKKTLCDNAIRSVVMIDDDFITYSESIKALKKEIIIDEKKIISSQRAASLENFFQARKMICDIDNGAVNFDVDRIRKSDLIIIDYHLNNEAPDKTINILNELRDSEHLNLIVIYTRENLDKVWLQVSSSLRGFKKVEEEIINHENDEIAEYWSNEVSVDLNNNGEKKFTKEELIEYINSGCTNLRVKQLIREQTECFDDEEIVFLVDMIAESSISRNSIIDNKKIMLNLKGDIGGCKWIQVGNIFIALFHKEPEDHENDGERIWQTLNNSLVEWNPSYYQVIKSEIQNTIESDALSFVNHLANDVNAQGAWLNEIINSKAEDMNGKIESFFTSLSEELYYRLKNNSKLVDFINSVFEGYREHYRNSGMKKTLEYCSKTLGLPSDDNTHQEMYHALNMNLSSCNFEDKYISTGTIFYDVNSVKWYLCVSAACDLVPTQGNDPHHKRLTPHRLIKVIELFEVAPKKALKQAHFSKYIYVIDNKKRKYLSIFEGDKNIPVVDYMVVLNHGENKNDKGKNIVSALFISNVDGDVKNQQLNLKLKSQLRSGYAERYQAIASHYSSRIGVDYISMLLN